MLPIRLFKSGGDGGRATPLSTLAGRSLEFEDLFDRAFGRAADGGFHIDVRQDGDELVIDADVPGLSRDDLEITVENNVLTIAGEYKSATDEENAHYHIRQRRRGRLCQSLRLPETADGEKVTAELEKGVLTLRVPTREEAKPRRIEVK